MLPISHYICFQMLHNKLITAAVKRLTRMQRHARLFSPPVSAHARKKLFSAPVSARDMVPAGDSAISINLHYGDSRKSRVLTARVGATLLDVAHDNGINVDGTCDGKLECSTCHCVVSASANDEIYKRTENLILRSQLPGESGSISTLLHKRQLERDLLDSAFAVKKNSRLSCQVRVTTDMEGMDIRYPNIIEKKDDNGGAPSSLKESPDSHASPTPDSLATIEPKKFRNITKSYIREMFETHGKGLPCEPFLKENLEIYSALADVLPMRTNNYVVEELIDWSNVPADPIFQLTFPQPGMLDSKQIDEIVEKKRKGMKKKELRALANVIREGLNPHPAKQKEMNVPSATHPGQSAAEAPSSESAVDFERGMQHKYRETVLFFPSESQYCHSYCMYCFRWAQFVGSSDLQFASNDLEELLKYLRKNKSVTDLLITGGDPMVMNAKQITRYLYPIANDPELEHLQNIRIGTKSLAYWPYKYVTDDGADDLLEAFQNVCAKGKHVSFMSHFTHPAELKTPVVREAIRRIRNTGVIIRAQAPLVDHINNDPDIWAKMWKEEVRLGLVPYYMFVERDTGAKEWFSVPLERSLEVYNAALAKVPGLARTVRGPSMSCEPGKVCLIGIETLPSFEGSPNAVLASHGGSHRYEEKVFVLKFLQSRNPDWIGRIFFAKYDPNAAWMSDLQPAFGDEQFFFQAEHDRMEQDALQGSGSSGQLFS